MLEGIAILNISPWLAEWFPWQARIGRGMRARSGWNRGESKNHDDEGESLHALGRRAIKEKKT